jgi:hypothetical protein
MRGDGPPYGGIELAKVTEKAVSREELYKEDDEAPAAGGQG